MTISPPLPLDEQLAVCETVVLTLRSQRDMTNTLERLSIPHQLEAIRFMEFLSNAENSFSSNEPFQIEVLG